MPIHSIVRKARRHYSSPAVVYQNVETISVGLDLFRDRSDLGPVLEVTVDPFHAVGDGLTQLGGDGSKGAVEHFLLAREDVEFGKVVFEKSIGDAEADAFGPSRDDGHFVGEVGGVVEGEGGGADAGGDGAAEVFGYGVLDGAKC